MKGNQRPHHPAMAAPAQKELPSARIRCSSGRIQVGSRSYQSASDALSAYMQQFDSGKSGSGSSVIRDSHAGSSTFRHSAQSHSSSHRGKLDPANVTALLTTSPEENGIEDSMMMPSSRVLNGGSGGVAGVSVSSPLRSSAAKHSVSFTLPDDSSVWRDQHSSKLSSSSMGHSHSHSHAVNSVNNHRHLSPSSVSLGDSRFLHSSNGRASDWGGMSQSQLSNNISSSSSMMTPSPYIQASARHVSAGRTSSGHASAGASSAMPVFSQASDNRHASAHSVSQANGFAPNGVVATTTTTNRKMANGAPAKTGPTMTHEAPFAGSGNGSSGFRGKVVMEEGGSQRRAKSEVEELLTEAPSPTSTSSQGRPLLLPGQGSSGEVKLRNLLQETGGSSGGLESSSTASSDKSALQQEVEQALSRSAQLLETIKTDVLVSPRSPSSEVGSLSTDVLLSINPLNPKEAINCVNHQATTINQATRAESASNPFSNNLNSAADVVKGREGRSRHRYSYHTSSSTRPPRSVSVGAVMGAMPESSPFPSRGQRGRRRSVDSMDSMSVSLPRQKAQNFSDSMSALSDSDSIIRRLQASTGLAAAVGTEARGPPSWIQELMPVGRDQDMAEDSVFSARDESTGGRKAPSWVKGLDQSEIDSSIIGGGGGGGNDLHDATETLMLVRELHGADTVRKAFQAAIDLDESSPASQLSFTGPGLQFSDLVTSPAGAGRNNRGALSERNGEILHHRGMLSSERNGGETLTQRNGGGIMHDRNVFSSSDHRGLLPSEQLQRGKFSGRKVTRTQSLTDKTSPCGPRRSAATAALDRSKPPVTMHRVFQDLAGLDAVTTAGPQSHPTTNNLSSSLGALEGGGDGGDSPASILRRKVCEDSADLRRSLDRFLVENGNRGGGGGRGGVGDLLKSEIPRCSSMLERGSGEGEEGEAEVPSNVTGASSITRDSNFSSRLCLDDPSLTPAKQRAALSPLRAARREEGQVTEEERRMRSRGVEEGEPDLLDGDRPWERMVPSFKAPVYVGNGSPAHEDTEEDRPQTPTLSGGQQPGSMEALKQMLFRLQNEESSSPSPSSAAIQNGEGELVTALRDYDFEDEPGGQSLERALVHLGRLKTLVQSGTAQTHPQQ